MVTLFSPLPDRIEVGGKEILLAPSFDRVLEAFSVQRDPDLAPEDKLEYLAFLIFQDYKRVKAQIWPEAVEAAFNLLLPEKGKGSGPRAFDFIQDAQLIYAGFMQAYHLDLYEQQGRLHWLKFIALFQGLPRDTKIMQVIDIRMRPVPAPNKHNAKEIEELMRLKSLYMLKMTQEERESQFQQGLQKVAKTIMNGG